MLSLTVEKRELTGKRVKSLRAAGMLPAVVYGAKESSTPISVAQREFAKVWKEAGESTVITLSGLDEEKEVLIHDIDVDPVSGELRHADFYAIEKGKKVQVKVALVFEGVAPAVKELGGTLVKVLYEIEVEAEPKNLPHEIIVDAATLVDFESQILVKDIKLPESVTVITEGNEVIALVEEQREEEPEEVIETPDLSDIEVEQKGKEEDSSTKEETSPSAEEEKSSSTQT